MYAVGAKSEKKKGSHLHVDNQPAKERSPLTKAIVFIGDWYLDENWLVAKEKSLTSSHTGDIHYLSKHKDISGRMINLCGTSEILDVLKSFFEKKHMGSHKYAFYGYGTWNQKDNDILQCILCQRNFDRIPLTPFTITSVSLPRGRGSKQSTSTSKNRICPYDNRKCEYKRKSHVELINIASNPQSTTTNRVIRCYEGFGSGRPHLLYRFDWQLPAGDLEFSKFPGLSDVDVAAVIVEDHGNGVINSKTIEALHNVLSRKPDYTEIKWYIRSKIDKPQWLKEFIQKDPEPNIRLRVIDFKLADLKMKGRRWHLGSELSRAALEVLAELRGDYYYKHLEKHCYPKGSYPKRAAILLDDNTLFAIEGCKCYNLKTPPGPKQLINVGRTTIFFSALIAQDLLSKAAGEDFGEQCQFALRCAYDWTKKATEAWSMEEPYLYGNTKVALDILEKKVKQAKKRTNPLPDPDEKIKWYCFHRLWQSWNSSSSELGVVYFTKEPEQCRNCALKESCPELAMKKKLKDVIQTWRGECAIDNYICIGGPKRDDLNDLLLKIYQFQDQKNPRYPFMCLLTAGPGWGKSFLAQSIAKKLSMRYMPFSLAQMGTKSEIIDCFDTICSVQNSTQEKVLVFIDELNCKIAGSTALELLLSPMWGGTFTKDGRTYRLAPAVWIFASTDPQLMEFDKGTDFLSRINGPIIKLDYIDTKAAFDKGISELVENLKRQLMTETEYINKNNIYSRYYSIYPKRETAIFRTEQVYHGISHLNKIWGPISKIQKEVLQLFHDIMPINGARSIELFVSQFRNIRRGIILCSNVPYFDGTSTMNRHIIVPEEWLNTKRPIDPQRGDESKLISIESVIPE